MTASPAPSPVRPGSARRGRRRVVIAALILATALAVGVGVWLLVASPFTTRDDARAAAERYLDAIATGDVDTVEAMLPGTDADADALAGEAFAGASGHVGLRSWDMLSASDDTGRARADIELAGETRTLEIEVVRTDDGWRLSSGLVDASFDVALTRPSEEPAAFDGFVAVGGARIPATAHIALVPAVYPVTGVPAEILDGTADAALSTDREAVVDLALTLSPDALGVVQDRVDGYAERCTRDATTVPAHCGILVPWGADFTDTLSFAYRVDAAPRVVLSADARSFLATDGAYTVTVEGRTRDGGTGSVTYRSTDWTLRGQVVFEADGMALEVR